MPSAPTVLTCGRMSHQIDPTDSFRGACLDTGATYECHWHETGKTILQTSESGFQITALTKAISIWFWFSNQRRWYDNSYTNIRRLVSKLRCRCCQSRHTPSFRTGCHDRHWTQYQNMSTDALTCNDLSWKVQLEKTRWDILFLEMRLRGSTVFSEAELQKTSSPLLSPLS